MNENISLQHVQVPAMDIKKSNLNFIDPYVYACIKRYMNSQTHKAFPSIDTLVKDSKLNHNTILESISRLETAGYISTVKKKGCNTQYIFSPYTKFEIFSYDFLDLPNLTQQEKAYLIILQNFMYKDNTLEIGKVTLTDIQISNLLNVNMKTLKKYETSLQEKGVLNKLQIKKRDEGGVKVNERIYSFPQFANAVALKFLETDSKLEEHEERINQTQQQFEILNNEVKRLQEMVAKLQARERQKIIIVD